MLYPTADKVQVTYSCVVFRPFKGEVLDAVVTQVTKVPHH